jgi:hypothetical protein
MRNHTVADDNVDVSRFTNIHHIQGHVRKLGRHLVARNAGHQLHAVAARGDDCGAQGKARADGQKLVLAHQGLVHNVREFLQARV